MDPLNPMDARLLTQWKGGGLQTLDWSPDGEQILADDYRSINDSTLYLVDAKTGERKQLTPKEPAGATVAWSDAKFAADGRGIFTTTDTAGEFQQLCRLSLAGAIEECLTKDIPHDVEEFAVSHDGKYLAFLVNDEGISRLQVRDLKSGKDVRLERMPIGVAEGLRFREESDELGFSLSTPQQPYDTYSVELPSGKLTRWTTSETGGISFADAKSPELIHWKAADGLMISGFLYPPPAKFSGKRPVMIEIHGGPEGQSRPEFLGSFNYYVQAMGIALIDPNVRGSTGYGKGYTMLDNGMKRQDSVHDIGALLDWIRTRPDLDPDRVVVVGGSYGGFMTLSVATQYNDRIRCSIDIVGPSNLVTFLENTSGYRRDLRRVEYGDEARSSRAKLSREDSAGEPCRCDHQAHLHRCGRERSSRAVFGVREHDEVGAEKRKSSLVFGSEGRRTRVPEEAQQRLPVLFIDPVSEAIFAAVGAAPR
jgi:dipeptidyl aminopeptidase/acylaminoacyl peptidase